MGAPLISPVVHEWVAKELGGRIVAGRRLTGGITSVVHRLSVDGPSTGTRTVVLRQWPEGKPDSIESESKVLRLLGPTPIPAPVLLAASTGTETAGTPCLVMTRMPGRLDLAPTDWDSWVRQMAAMLASIQDLGFYAGFPVYDPSPRPSPEDIPPWASDPQVWHDAFTVLQQPSRGDAYAFTHADFQHFNVLWSRGKLTGIVDWVAPHVTSPDLDPAHCRLHLVLLHGVEIAEMFRAAYEAEAGRRIDPWWDLHRLTGYNPTEWHSIIQRQVSRRVPLDITGMTDRVEQALRTVLRRV